MDRDFVTDQYTIAVKAGILKGKYARNQFDLCPQRLLSTEDISTERTLSLCEAVAKQSGSDGQGFSKCNCAGLTDVKLTDVNVLKQRNCVTLNAMQVCHVLTNNEK